MMKPSITYRLLRTLQHGADQLSDEARQRVCRYVLSQRDEHEAFISRGSVADLYYTMFGWMLCYALDISSDSSRRKAYLQTVDASSLDQLHQTVLALSQMLNRLLSLPRFAQDAAMLLMADDAPLLRFFEAYQRHGSGGGTNAWAARLVMATEANKKLVNRLLSVQHESGGFLAYEGAVMPDLLSTAVAMFALREKGVGLRFDARPFIEAHCQEDGSFVATLLDEFGDVEYVFYGLLAIGSMVS